MTQGGGEPQPQAVTRNRLGRLAVIALGVLAAAAVVHASGWDAVELLRRSAVGSGASGAILFAVGYAVLTVTPLPKNALSTTAGLLFGFGTGLLVVWCGAMTGALIAFGLARRFGRGAGRIPRAPRARLDALLTRHGLLGSVLVRLLPVLPFTAVNYASGLSSLRLRHYVLGTAIGILPGSVIFVGIGAGTTVPPGWSTLGLALASGVLAVALGRLRNKHGERAGGRLGERWPPSS